MKHTSKFKLRKNYSLLIPPPNLTGELHLGHAMQHSILDAIARYKRLCGYNVLLLPGVDHAGIQFESTFNKNLSKKNISRKNLSREKWLELAWKFKDEIYKSVSDSWRLMGLSANWEREVFTLDEKPQRAVFKAFKAFYENELIYKGPYIVQWCPKDNTAIEDVEMEYQEKEEKLFFIKYLVEGTENTFIEVATVRPETIFADVAIALYPNHPKYKQFVGKKVFLPLPDLKGRLIPVIEDVRVQKDFGTGALKVTPGHDLLDYEIGKDNNLKILQVVNKEGKLTSLAGELEGLNVVDGREKALDILKKNNAFAKEEPLVHSVAVCERCKSVVEPLISDEWFLKVDQLAKRAIEQINAGKINFLPKNYNKILVEWLNNIHDWCISRSLWWGHRIPVWYDSTKANKLDSIRISIESPGKEWIQDEQVLDTWFSSGLWPLATLGWGSENEEGDFQKYFPWDFEISAPEIKYLWIARMIMLSVYFKESIPFKTMFFHGMLRDLEGRKFSKSLGNGIDPSYLIDRWGVDATRMTLYSYAAPGRDGRVSKQILDERSKNYRNFSTKIKNIARFILELKPKDRIFIEQTNHKDDLEIKKELKKTQVNISTLIDKNEFHLAIDEIYNFIWHKFADFYIEKSKSRRNEAQLTLEYILLQSMILLHPFMPFLTEEIYHLFPKHKKSIILEQWQK